ncbi:hypothetical protein B0H11DRAFT_2196704 [Mycena galericulata]|nr:hypothetical protein B0H11DRAFT_2196704 [Mycena galericulata]
MRGSGFDSATQVTRALLIRVDGMGRTRSAGHTDGAGAHEAKGVPGTVVMRCLEGSVTLAAAGDTDNGVPEQESEGSQLKMCTARGEGPHEADATQRERRWEMERKGHRRPKCDAAQLECGGATDGGVRRSAMRIDAKRERGNEVGGREIRTNIKVTPSVTMSHRVGYFEQCQRSIPALLLQITESVSMSIRTWSRPFEFEASVYTLIGDWKDLKLELLIQRATGTYKEREREKEMYIVHPPTVLVGWFSFWENRCRLWLYSQLGIQTIDRGVVQLGGIGGSRENEAPLVVRRRRDRSMKGKRETRRQDGGGDGIRRRMEEQIGRGDRMREEGGGSRIRGCKVGRRRATGAGARRRQRNNTASWRWKDLHGETGGGGEGSQERRGQSGKGKTNWFQRAG